MTADALSMETFERIVFFTGAGLSAESGLPTYRGQGGIWGDYDWRSCACQAAFDRDPETVWDFHDERRLLMAGVEPCLAHRIIAAVEQHTPGTTVVTQNIDGLHRRAGSTDVAELHGSIGRVRCACPPGLQENLEAPITDRRCPDCRVWRRPDIVWFEDPMQPAPIEAAIDAIASCDLLISIGTSGAVYPAADLPRLALETGATCVEINPEETPVSHWYGIHMRGGASAMLSQLWPDLAEL